MLVHENSDSSVSEKPRVLIATPVKNAAAHLARYFENLERLTYPRDRLSLGILESDSEDGSFEALADGGESLRDTFNQVHLFQRDLGLRISVARLSPEN